MEALYVYLPTAYNVQPEGLDTVTVVWRSDPVYTATLNRL